MTVELFAGPKDGLVAEVDAGSNAVEIGLDQFHKAWYVVEPSPLGLCNRATWIGDECLHR